MTALTFTRQLVHSRKAASCRLVGALALGLTLMVAAPAPAQFGLQSGFQDAFRPGFTGRDVQMAVEMLELDSSQKFILETLYEDYQEEFRTGVNTFRQSITDMRSTLGTDPGQADPSQVMRIVFGSMEDWRKEAQGLVEQFTEDLQGLLNEDQAALWPAFQRRMYRQKYLNNGQLSGESLDLLAAVRDMKLDAPVEASLHPILEEYEVRLDHALRQREDYVNRTQGDLLQAIQTEDPTVGIEVGQRQADLRKVIRDVNETYAARIVEALGGEVGQRFRTEVLKMTYPRVFRTTQVERIFMAAKRIEGLDEDTLTAVMQLEAQYLGALAGFNEQLVSITRSFEPAELQNKVEVAAARMSGASVERLTNPTREKFQERRDMGNRYVEQLKSLLTPEQFAALPGAGRYASPGDLKGKRGTKAAGVGDRGVSTKRGTEDERPEDN
ncbi:MAG: hypothetical protein ACYS0D_00430 [Planctomycetota bacterium]|jgi:Spy/CpxP family protein refolding chaperone